LPQFAAQLKCRMLASSEHSYGGIEYAHGSTPSRHDAGNISRDHVIDPRSDGRFVTLLDCSRSLGKCGSCLFQLGRFLRFSIKIQVPARFQQ
jgi:hypothetical protein